MCAATVTDEQSVSRQDLTLWIEQYHDGTIGEEAALLQRALKLVENDFAPHTWKAFWQFTIEGRSAKEIADEIGMSETGVRQAKFRVLARLREALGTQ